MPFQYKPKISFRKISSTPRTLLSLPADLVQHFFYRRSTLKLVLHMIGWQTNELTQNCSRGKTTSNQRGLLSCSTWHHTCQNRNARKEPSGVYTNTTTSGPAIHFRGMGLFIHVADPASIAPIHLGDHAQVTLSRRVSRRKLQV